MTSDKWGTRGMLRGCLIHPVAPLLSLLAPLFGPFFSPVRDVPDAAILRRKPLRSYDFCAAFRHCAGRKGVFPLLSGLKQGGAREAMIVLTVAGPVPDGLTPLNLMDTTRIQLLRRQTHGRLGGGHPARAAQLLRGTWARLHHRSCRASLRAA
jgi:hypothetical protein